MNEMRKTPHQRNSDLIDMIAEHDNSEAIYEQILDVMCQEMELNISDLLCAYRNHDVDDMFLALTGWDLESIMAKAKVIPDTKHMFYANTEVIPGDVVFPLFGKETLTEQEFLDYLRRECEVSDTAMTIVRNAVEHAKLLEGEQDRKRSFLWTILDGIPNIDEETIFKVVL